MSGKTFVGIDTSMTGTGISVLDACGCSKIITTIKTEKLDYKDEISRIIFIRDRILEIIPQDSIVCIEGVYTPHNALTIGPSMMLNRLAGVVRTALYERGITFYIVQPTQLKKFLLGKGSGEKSLIMMNVLDKYGIKTLNDNEADGFVLSVMAKSMENRDGITKTQEDVLKSVMEAGIWQKDDNWAPEKKVRAKKSKETV